MAAATPSNMRTYSIEAGLRMLFGLTEAPAGDDRGRSPNSGKDCYRAKSQLGGWGSAPTSDE
jgi:hypothetical protein